ncbi:NADAR family protein [Mucilaginibacter sp. Bleaf8]|uniref:NADAR family protein n=1 Tax=Mucilaginibacter sp. Bleaf8 TaxID=2834430 RepID=UPI001BCE494B|nr:NADAR family protein [Mucilaginibacter sp. Bleaf8]MBS7565610.1 NADAR family protein [Mucilaginibacter sp. Bleaf8]
MAKYDIEWLINQYEINPEIDFLFFWGHSAKYAETGKSCLSQWYELPFIVNDVTYLTAEHWMMAAKAILFGDSIAYKSIIDSKTAGKAKHIGQQIKNFDSDIWDAYKHEIVVNGNVHKFNQHPRLAKYLISTGNQILVEASPIDTIWGIGLAADDENSTIPYCWRGTNLLGFALMEVREFLSDFGKFDYLKTDIQLPWVLHPCKDSADMYWRMGEGENIIDTFNKYYLSLTDREKTIFRLMHPLPSEWQHFLL